jgi:TonB-dependent SusC/RagA subfamily outer membrane receptor
MKKISIITAFFILTMLRVSGQDSLMHADILTLRDSSFNRGNIQSPYQLMQGRFSGVLISRAGSNLNQNFDVRIRGISTVHGRVNPLIIVDGIPTDQFLSIDPNDIESIQILKGAETAQYGIQGASGVVIINTKRGNDERFWVNYGVYGSFEQKIQKVRVLTAEEYLASGGNDSGGRTDWLRETTQNAMGINHQVSMGGTAGHFKLRGSLNYRNFNGIQNETGFRRLNGLFGADGNFFGGKLIIHYTGSLANEDAELGFNNVFQQVLQVSPALPVQFESGQYIEPNLFSQFNPVAMIKENSNKRTHTNQLHAFNARYNFGKIYIETISGINQFKANTNETYGSSQAAYRTGQKFDSDQNDLRYRVSGVIGGNWQTSSLKIESKVGIDRQQLDHRYQYTVFYPRSGAYVVDEKMVTTTLAYFASFKLSSKNAYVNMLDRVEGSSALGDGHKRGNFYSLGGGYNLSNITHLGSQWMIETSTGRSGLTPYAPFKEAKYATNFSVENPDLTYEGSHLFDIGSRFVSKSGKWSVSANRYFKNSTSFMFFGWVGQQQSYQNSGKLNNRGWEIEAWALLIKSENLEISTGLAFTTLKTQWKKMPADSLYSGNASGSANFVAHLINQPYGQLYGPISEGIQQNDWKLKDLDKSGSFDMYRDLTVIGQALPKFWLGWNNTIRFKKFSCSFLWQGVFGHSNANMTDMQYRVNNNPYYNTIKTTMQTTSDNRWSNEFAEKASYFRLQYISFDYKFDLQKLTRIKDLRAFVVANNLITITRYAGNDPEVRITDEGYLFNGEERPNYRDSGNANFTPGIDRPSTWLPSRSFVIGLKAGF